MAKRQTQRVVFQPTAYRGIRRDINQIVNAVRPTLGPPPRIVAIEQAPGDKMPELLDDGGVIARRIIELPNRDKDAGAMFIRHVLWRLHEEVGDGTATAAVLFQSVYNQGVRYIVAGGSPNVLVMLSTALLVSRDGGQSWSDWKAGLAFEQGLASVAAPQGLDPGVPLLVGLVEGGVLRV
jgi:hypothetical protein